MVGSGASAVGRHAAQRCSVQTLHTKEGAGAGEIKAETARGARQQQS